MQDHSIPPLDHDPADSSFPNVRRAPFTLKRVGEAEDWRELVAAIAAAMTAAVDTRRPHATTGKCLTISSIVTVVSEHPARLEWAVGALRQVTATWQHDNPA